MFPSSNTYKGVDIPCGIDHICMKPQQLFFILDVWLRYQKRGMEKSPQYIQSQPVVPLWIPLSPLLSWELTGLVALRHLWPEGCSHHPRHCHPPLPHHCGFFYALRQPSYLFMLLYNMISQTIPQKYFIELKWEGRKMSMKVACSLSLSLQFPKAGTCGCF